MGLGPAQILDRISKIVSGNGFKRCIDGISIQSLTEADGDNLDNASTPALAALETNTLGVNVASSATLIGCLNFKLPRDYDESLDQLRINLLAVSESTADTPTLTATAYRKRTGAALSSALTIVDSAAIPISTAYAAWRVVGIDSNSLKGGDVIHVTLSTVAHTTDAAYILGVEVEYRGDLVYFLLEDR